MKNICTKTFELVYCAVAAGSMSIPRHDQKIEKGIKDGSGKEENSWMTFAENSAQISAQCDIDAVFTTPNMR